MESVYKLFLSILFCLSIPSINSQTMIKGVPVAFPEDDIHFITPAEITEGWRQIFTMMGFDADPQQRDDAWYVNGNTQNGNGGIWIIEDSTKGIISSTQAGGGEGGVGMTRKRFQNFEISLDMNIGWGNDGGIFARTTLNGVAYQSMIDYTDGGNIGGLWPEATGEGWFNWPFKISSNGRNIDNSTLWFDQGDWDSFWRPGQWNHFRWRVEGGQGEKPRTKAWINGIQVVEEIAQTDFVPSGKMDSDYKGTIGIQVHQGSRWRGGPNRYKNLRLLELQDEDPYKPLNQCEDQNESPYNSDGQCENLLSLKTIKRNKYVSLNNIQLIKGDIVKVFNLKGKIVFYKNSNKFERLNLNQQLPEKGIHIITIQNQNNVSRYKVVNES